MLATVRAPFTRLHRAISQHTVAVGISLGLAAAVAAAGAGFAIANPATPDTATTAAITGVAGGTPAATSTRTDAHPVIRALIGLTARGTDLTVAQVRALLRQNETINQIAGSDAASVARAAEAAVTAKIEARVPAGKLSSSQEAALVTRVQARVTQIMSAPGHSLIRALRGASGHAGAASPSPSPPPPSPQSATTSA